MKNFEAILCSTYNNPFRLVFEAACISFSPRFLDFRIKQLSSSEFSHNQLFPIAFLCSKNAYTLNAIVACLFVEYNNMFSFPCHFIILPCLSLRIIANMRLFDWIKICCIYLLIKLDESYEDCNWIKGMLWLGILLKNICKD